MSRASSPQPLRVVDWGRRDYASSLAAQRELQAAVIAGDAPDTLVLVEHDPVITVTPRAAKLRHVVAPADRLAQLGIELHETDRGGDVTYHGPGQLVAYPILHLHRYGLNLSKHMRLLEAVVIDTAAALGIEAHREPASPASGSMPATVTRHASSAPWAFASASTSPCTASPSTSAPTSPTFRPSSLAASLTGR